VRSPKTYVILCLYFEKHNLRLIQFSGHIALRIVHPCPFCWCACVYFSQLKTTNSYLMCQQMAGDFISTLTKKDKDTEDNVDGVYDRVIAFVTRKVLILRSKAETRRVCHIMFIASYQRRASGGKYSFYVLSERWRCGREERRHYCGTACVAIAKYMTQTGRTETRWQHCIKCA
jgi:hypothetical protein